MTRAAVAATITRWPCDLPAGVTQLEVHADVAGDVAPRFPGSVIYTLRGGGPSRRQRLMWAAGRYDVVDLDVERDIDPALLAAIPAERRRLSWHGPAEPLDRLRERFAAMARIPAARYLLAPAADRARDALVPLRLLHSLGRRDVTAYGTGPAGTWSRLLAPWLGAPVVTGAVGGPSPDGAPDVARLVTDYGFPHLRRIRELYGIAGGVARTTGFPRVHNRAYRRLRLPALFLPFYLPTVDDFVTGFWPHVPDGLRDLGLPLRGFTVSGPLKEAALSVADQTGPAALACGSANIMLARPGGWLAETTDASAVAAVLRRAGVTLPGRAAVVVGCGGAGRAAAVALASGGARVTLVNRTETRGRAAAQRLGLPYAESVAPVGPATIVHATPVHDRPLVPLDGLTAGATVVDFVCATEETALVATARRLGLRAIDGWTVLAAEAEQQFLLMTGTGMPPTRRPKGAGHAAVTRPG